MSLVNAPLSDGNAPSPKDRIARLAALPREPIKATNRKANEERTTDRFLINSVTTWCAEELINNDGANSQEMRDYFRKSLASLDEGQINFWLRQHSVGLMIQVPSRKRMT